MSNPDICRGCEAIVVEDAEFCSDCAEMDFVDLMRSDAGKRWDVYTGGYYYSNAAEIDRYSDAVFEAWCERNPEKAGKLLFKLFDRSLQNYQLDGDL